VGCIALSIVTSDWIGQRFKKEAAPSMHRLPRPVFEARVKFRFYEDLFCQAVSVDIGIS
jgi:hypothetical protein